MENQNNEQNIPQIKQLHEQLKQQTFENWQNVIQKVKKEAQDIGHNYISDGFKIDHNYQYLYCPYKYSANKKGYSNNRYFNCKAKLAFFGNNKQSEFVFNVQKSNFIHNHPIQLQVRLNRHQESIQKICQTGRALSNREISREFKRQIQYESSSESRDLSLSDKKLDKFISNQKYQQKIQQYGKNTNEDIIRVENIMKWLKVEFPNMYYDSVYDRKNNLKQLTFITPKMKDNINKFGDLVRSDCTHDVVEQSFLTEFRSGIDQNNLFCMFQVSIIPSEDKNIFGYTFQKFLEVGGYLNNGQIVRKLHNITDEGMGYMSLYQKYRTQQLLNWILCGFHKRKNFLEKISKVSGPIYGHNELGSRESVLSLPFNKHENNVKDIFKNIQNSDNLNQNTKEYFKQQEQYKHLWCRAFNNNRMSLGQLTNSPAESYNSLFKRVNQHPDRILQVCVDLQYNSKPELNRAYQQDLQLLQKHQGNLQQLKQQFGDQYSNFAYATLVKQQLLFDQYEMVYDTDDNFENREGPYSSSCDQWQVCNSNETDIHTISSYKKNGQTQIFYCDCDIHQSFGIPCVGLLKLQQIQPIRLWKDKQKVIINKRWINDNNNDNFCERFKYYIQNYDSIIQQQQQQQQQLIYGNNVTNNIININLSQDKNPEQIQQIIQQLSPVNNITNQKPQYTAKTGPKTYNKRRYTLSEINYMIFQQSQKLENPNISKKESKYIKGEMKELEKLRNSYKTYQEMREEVDEEEKLKSNSQQSLEEQQGAHYVNYDNKGDDGCEQQIIFKSDLL